MLESVDIEDLDIDASDDEEEAREEPAPLLSQSKAASE